jgi:hypothetical protein
VAHASITYSSQLEDDTKLALTKVRADLFEIMLDQPKQRIFAVVLAGHVDLTGSTVYELGYQVSVLERITENPGVLGPIIFNPAVLFAAWNGRYEKPSMAMWEQWCDLGSPSNNYLLRDALRAGLNMPSGLSGTRTPSRTRTGPPCSPSG